MVPTTLLLLSYSPWISSTHQSNCLFFFLLLLPPQTAPKLSSFSFAAVNETVSRPC